MTKHQRGAPLSLCHRKVSIDGWELDAFRRFDEVIASAVAEALVLAFNDEDTTVAWPAAYGHDSDGEGGPGVTDPLTLYLRVALHGTDDLEPPVFAFNLREAIQRDIDDCREDGSYRRGLSDIRNALGLLVHDLDAAINAAR